MTIEQVKNELDKLSDKKCPLTERLVKSGFQQKQSNDGYTKNARNATPKVVVDFRQALPTQEWHFYESFYANTEDVNQEFANRYSCGEFIFWLAEKLDVEPLDSDRYASLEDLVNEVIKILVFKGDEVNPNKLLNKREGNQLIRKQCWGEIERRLRELSE